MRVLVIYHGWRPGPDRPVSGGALRAWRHVEALEAAGHQVQTLSRAQDRQDGDPPGYGSPGELRQMVELAQPDRVLVVQPEEAASLAGIGIPMAVDFYAPRVLEALYERRLERELPALLQALSLADLHLFSNPRQRRVHLGLMALLGVDLRERGGAVVPLVAPELVLTRPPRSEPQLVMGGVSWPWQDPRAGVRAALEVLQERDEGELLIFGGRPVLGDSDTLLDLRAELRDEPRLSFRDPLPYSQLLQVYAGASLALDWMSPNVEREQALSFRQVDYLGAGLPLLTSAHHALSDAIRRWEAGWVVETEADLPGALREALSDPEELRRRGESARALARAEHGLMGSEQALLDWVARDDLVPTAPAPLPLLDRADLARRLAASEREQLRLEDRAERYRTEARDKREENAGLSQQVRQLTATTERLARALDEVAGLRRESLQIVGTAEQASREEAQLLHRELGEVRADRAKKEAERGQLERLRDRLREELDQSRALVRDLEGRLQASRSAEGTLQDELKQLREELSRERVQQAVAQGEIRKKEAETEALRQERDLLRQHWEQDQEGARDRELRLQQQISTLQGEAQKKTLLLAQGEEALHRLQDKTGHFESEVERLSRELRAQIAENERLARRRFLR